ncbi:MAG: hypothetical protein ACI9VL_001973 [Colwellia sp.]|jgi:hypothetical protein
MDAVHSTHETKVAFGSIRTGVEIIIETTGSNIVDNKEVFRLYHAVTHCPNIYYQHPPRESKYCCSAVVWADKKGNVAVIV